MLSAMDRLKSHGLFAPWLGALAVPTWFVANILVELAGFADPWVIGPVAVIGIVGALGAGISLWKLTHQDGSNA